MRDPRLISFSCAFVALTASCGGAASSTSSPSQTTAAATVGAGVRVSSTSAFDPNCGRNETGMLFLNAEVEPHLALNPARAGNLIAAWQQDRWSNGAARGVVTASSSDGGATWSQRTPPFSRCAGGSFERASDPWVSIGPTGIAHQMVLSVTGAVFGAGSLSAMLAVRSTDGGLTWSPPRTLIQDTAPFFNDKNSVTADPFDERFVYAVWDRLQQNAGGPAYFARSIDAGATWEPARIAYDPGATSQIIGAELVVIPSGDLLYFFTQLDSVGAQTQASVAFVRSRDRGQSWGSPTIVSRSFSVGTRDPETGAAVRDGGILMHAAAASGTLAVAWQDGRFSNGARDGVAFSQSRDGGVTWSDVVQINAAPAAGAFTPQPQISNDGLITVGYFDLRANTPDPATLPATYWLARSTDGRNWTETSLAGPFNLSNAANAGGAFIGDYVGLVAAGSSTLSLLAVSGDDLNNRSDVFFATSSFVRAAGASAIRGYRATAAPEGPISPELDRRASENIVLSLGPKLTLRRPGPRSR